MHCTYTTQLYFTSLELNENSHAVLISHCERVTKRPWKKTVNHHICFWSLTLRVLSLVRYLRVHVLLIMKTDMQFRSPVLSECSVNLVYWVKKQKQADESNVKNLQGTLSASSWSSYSWRVDGMRQEHSCDPSRLEFIAFLAFTPYILRDTSLHPLHAPWTAVLELLACYR